MDSVSDTKVDELMAGRQHRESMFMGVPSGKWAMWTIGLVAAIALGYFGVVKTVDANSAQLQQLGGELIETRKAIRELDHRLDQVNIEFVQLRAIVQQGETLEDIGQTLRDIFDTLQDPPARRRR